MEDVVGNEVGFFSLVLFFEEKKVLKMSSRKQ